MTLHLRIAVLFIACLAASGASGAEVRDGNWWNTLLSGDKPGYIVGFFDGVTYTATLFDGELLLAMGDPKTKAYSPERGRIIGEVSISATKQLKRDFANVNAGQLVAGLDKIYSDYRNTKIPVTRAMIAVLRGMQGVSDDQIAKWLEEQRKAASE